MKSRKISLILGISMSIMLSVPCKTFAAPVSNRFGGQNRYGTSTAISKNNWTAPVDSSKHYAVIVTGLNYPDALSAAPLAKKYDAPIFLVSKTLDTPDSQNADTKVSDELKRLKVTDVFIVGGTGVVSSNVENEIKKLSINIAQRFAGANRYDTAVKVANTIGTTNGIAIANGYVFQDALSVSSIAAKLGMPIILVPKDSFDSSSNCVLNYIKGKSIPKTYVVGGTDVISSKITGSFANVDTRIEGATPYERNINTIKKFKDKLDFSSIFIASGSDYPDGLCVSSLAAKSSSPVILVKSNSMDTATQNYITEIGASVKNINVSGGTGAVSQSVQNSIGEIIDSSSFGVESIE